MLNLVSLEKTWYPNFDTKKEEKKSKHSIANLIIGIVTNNHLA